MHQQNECSYCVSKYPELCAKAGWIFVLCYVKNRENMDLYSVRIKDFAKVLIKLYHEMYIK